MALAERVEEILRGLPRGWSRARIELTVEEDGDADRAAIVLAPVTPGHSGATFTLYAHAGDRQPGPSAERVRRCLARLDDEGVRARVRLVSHEEPSAAAGPGAVPATLAGSWDALVRRLPPDWSDLYAEIELDSTDYLERGALLLAPVNPARHAGPPAFRFRCASSTGYGVAAGMARRAFERLDDEGMTGRLRVLRVLSDTSSTFSQGPVWRENGRSV